MIEQLFEVATEFRFDVGQAILNTRALTDAVDGVSAASSNALRSINYLASGLVAHLGFGSGGLLTVLTKAVQISEQFDTVALNFSNVITTNFALLEGTIATFNDRLETSKVILDDISTVAIKFAIPTGELARISGLIATPLAQKGKLGRNFGRAIEMGKNLMLGAETVGLHSSVASESLYRSLTDHMPLHGALFARLVNTMPFKQARITTQSQLQAMRPEKKIDLLDNALKALAMDSDSLNFKLNSLHGQLQVLRNLFTDLGSALRPIGDAIKKPLITVLRSINQFISQHGKAIGESIGKLIGHFIEDPLALYVNLRQMMGLGKDVKRSIHLVELWGTLRFVQFILNRVLGITFNGGLLAALFRNIYVGLKYVMGLIPWSMIFSGALNLLRLALVEVLPLFLAFLYIFQVISRAKAIAQVNDLKAWVELTPRVAPLFVRLKMAIENILLPISMSIDFWAKLLARLFETTFWVKLLLPLFEQWIGMLEFLGKTVVYAMAGLSGIIEMLIGFVLDIIALKNPFKNATDNFADGWDRFLKENQARLGGDGIKLTANYVNNIGKIEARFDMREQLEPDRIAFAVTTHLQRLASNQHQARGGSSKAALSGSHSFAGDK